MPAAPPALPASHTLLPYSALSLSHTGGAKAFSPLQHRAKGEEEEEEEGEAVCRRAARAGTDVGIWLMEHPA